MSFLKHALFTIITINTGLFTRRLEYFHTTFCKNNLFSHSGILGLFDELTVIFHAEAAITPLRPKSRSIRQTSLGDLSGKNETH